MENYQDLFESKLNFNEDTNSSNFKKWFGKSKMTENGKPQIFYHGTNVDIESFDKRKIASGSGNYGHYGEGFYFSDDIREAKTYGRNILEVYLKIEKPFYGDDERYLQKYAKQFGDYEKVNVAFDKTWFLNALKKVDPLAYDLADNIIKYGFDSGWSKYLDKGYDTSKEKLDLNDVVDWIEMGLNTENPQEISQDFIDQITKILGKPKLVKDYPFNNRPQMHYMTDLGDYGLVRELTDQIKKDGYDGIVAGSELVVFEPNQIKSVTNNGNWSNSDNLYENKLKFEENIYFPKSVSSHMKIIYEAVVEYILDLYNLNVDLTFAYDKNSKDLGYVRRISNTLYMVHINFEQSLSMIIQSIAHELTHVKQYVDKELEHRDSNIYFKNQFVISESDYNKIIKRGDFKAYYDLPYETEAFIKGKDIMKKINNDKSFWDDFRKYDNQSINWILDYK